MEIKTQTTKLTWFIPKWLGPNWAVKLTHLRRPFKLIWLQIKYACNLQLSKKEGKYKYYVGIRLSIIPPHIKPYSSLWWTQLQFFIYNWVIVGFHPLVCANGCWVIYATCFDMSYILKLFLPIVMPSYLTYCKTIVLTMWYVDIKWVFACIWLWHLLKWDQNRINVELELEPTRPK